MRYLIVGFGLFYFSDRLCLQPLLLSVPNLYPTAIHAFVERV